MKFWILWGVDALIAAVPIFFFLAGLRHGTISAFNIQLWAVLLLGLAAVLVGSVLLRSHGHMVAAWIVLAIMAVPGLLAGIFFLVIILMKPRWN